MAPFHEHDCDCCVHLGSSTEREMDFYYCQGEKALIWRHGPDGQYGSFSVDICRSIANDVQGRDNASRNIRAAVALLDLAAIQF